MMYVYIHLSLDCSGPNRVWHTQKGKLSFLNYEEYIALLLKHLSSCEISF